MSLFGPKSPTNRLVLSSVPNLKMGSGSSTSLVENGFWLNTNNENGPKLEHGLHVWCDEKVNRGTILISLEGLSMVLNYVWQMDFQDDVDIVNDKLDFIIFLLKPFFCHKNLLNHLATSSRS